MIKLKDEDDVERYLFNGLGELTIYTTHGVIHINITEKNVSAFSDDFNSRDRKDFLLIPDN